MFNWVDRKWNGKWRGFNLLIFQRIKDLSFDKLNKHVPIATFNDVRWLITRRKNFLGLFFFFFFLTTFLKRLNLISLPLSFPWKSLSFSSIPYLYSFSVHASFSPRRSISRISSSCTRNLTFPPLSLGQGTWYNTWIYIRIRVQCWTSGQEQYGPRRALY